jgi:2-phosphoglycerate kinase
MTKPAVVLIGGDKGGVGKTTVARIFQAAYRQAAPIIEIAEA